MEISCSGDMAGHAWDCATLGGLGIGKQQADIGAESGGNWRNQLCGWLMPHLASLEIWPPRHLLGNRARQRFHAPLFCLRCMLCLLCNTQGAGETTFFYEGVEVHGPYIDTGRPGSEPVRGPGQASYATGTAARRRAGRAHRPGATSRDKFWRCWHCPSFCYTRCRHRLCIRAAH